MAASRERCGCGSLAIAGAAFQCASFLPEYVKSLHCVIARVAMLDSKVRAAVEFHPY
jgi:hypothetical protein